MLVTLKRFLMILAVLTVGAGTMMQLSARAAGAAPVIDTAAVQATLTAVVDSYAIKSNDTDLAYFYGGEWKTGQEANCWRCTLGPAVASAALLRATGNLNKKVLAEQTFDNLVNKHQAANGSYFPSNAGEGGVDITTMSAATQLASAYLLMTDYLSPIQKQRWSSSVVKAADFLIANGNLAWYTNGNIAVGNLEVMYQAYLVSGERRFIEAYEKALSFAMNPPQESWPGMGFKYTKTPTKADGSDGSGYFTEQGAGGVGFDAEYTSVQFDYLTRLYTMNQDPRVLRLMNLLVNQLMPRIDLTKGWLDTSNGTRHTEPLRHVGANMPGIAVLARNGRTDLVPAATALWPFQDLSARSTIKYFSNDTFYVLGSQMPSLLMAMTPTPRLPQSLPTGVTTTTTVAPPPTSPTTSNTTTTVVGPPCPV